MKFQILFLAGLLAASFLLISLLNYSEKATHPAPIPPSFDSVKTKPAQRIGEIPLPAGFVRVPVEKNSFAGWLRQIPLRKNNTVYYYNGAPVERQDLHYAVLDISTGNKDLQQCADAVMRLKAEYYFSKNLFDSIVFTSGDKKYSFKAFENEKKCYSHDCLMQFLEIVFINCGTYTIDEMTRTINIHDMQIGDVFVKAGAPGHTMIVADAAYNAQTKKEIYLLAQGYMPAQDMHIVINPENETLSPWYEVNDDKIITTPGFIFKNDQLKRWK